MQWFSRWTAGVCCAAVGCTVLELLYPGGVMQKPMRYVTALLFLAALVLPLSETVPGSLPEPEHTPSGIYSEVESLMEQQTVRLAEEQLTSSVRKLAADAGVEPVWTEVSIGQDDAGQYRLQYIHICLPEAQQSMAVLLSCRIEAQMGLRPEFSYVSQEVL